MILKKDADGNYTGEFKVVEKGTGDRAIGVQGADYYGGNLYINHSDEGATSIACVSMSDYSITDKTRYFYDVNGEKYEGGGQGVCIDNKYEYLFINRTSTTGQGTTKMFLQYHR